MKKLICLAIVMTQLQIQPINAQTVQPGFELLEILKISEVYRVMPNLSYNIKYIYADSVLPATVLEELNGFSKISEGRCYTMLDSMEYVQGYRYGVTVLHLDSTIVVGDTKCNSTVMQLPVLDSLFQKILVNATNVTQVNDSLRVLTIQFKGIAPYSQYKIHYNSNKYLVNKIEYFMRNVQVEEGAVTSGTALITLLLSNYSEQSFDKQIFQEDKFLYKLNGEIHAKPAYSNFKLVVNTTN